jgi:LuxR family maltose regulon positive regulatory protein
MVSSRKSHATGLSLFARRRNTWQVVRSGSAITNHGCYSAHARMAKPLSHPVAVLGKLAPPRLGRAFDRERLFGVLDGLLEHPAIWVAAGPGAGKSTLVATWLRSRGLPTLWLQVDHGDADPATFVQSLDALLSAAAVPAITLPAFHADDLGDLEGGLRRRLRLFMLHRAPPWALVFDNHQELPSDSLLHRALAACLQELPRGVQFIFISREVPPPAYARALVQQHLACVDAESLRFDETEVLALTRLHGHPDAFAGALAAAQGWAGGLALMLLGSPPDAQLPGLAVRQHLFDYFAGEVLARMPDADRDALCAIACLPSATAELAVAVSGNPEAAQLLERLAAQSLFTDRREGSPTVYVLHALFSEFLRRQFERTHTQSQWSALQRRAGQVLAGAGQFDAALQRLIESGEAREAQALLLRSAASFVASGRTDALRHFIDSLPQAQREPLLYWRGFSALDTDPLQALSDLQQAFVQCVASGDVDGQLAAAAVSCTALVFTARFKELDTWLDVLSTHADRAAERQSEDVEMCWVPGMLAAVVYRAPWHALAENLAERAERLLHRESVPGQRLLLGALAFHLLWRGHVDRLERIVLRIDSLCAQPLAASATLMRWWGVGILVKTLLGQQASALADAQRALALVDADPAGERQRARAQLLRMIVALACTDPAAARSSMERAALALHPDDAIDRSTYEHQRGIFALLEGDHPTALRLMRAAVDSGRAAGFPMREHIALIANALAATVSNEHAEAGRLLEQAFAHPFHAAARWHHWVGGMVAAYAALRRGDQRAALADLRGALGVARDCGFRHGSMLMCCGDMMATLAALALQHGIEADIARDIVLRNDLKAPPEAGNAWPWALKLQALGDWHLERSDGPLPVSRKESRRLQELLHLLVAQGNAAVRQEALADELWPEAEGDAARNALDNALHRLRKRLGGDDRIVLRQGALSLNRQRCWSDVAALELALSRPEVCDIEETAALVKAIGALYRGPLLPGVALAGVAARRTALHRRVQRLLQTAAQRLCSAGMTEDAAALRVQGESLPKF